MEERLGWKTPDERAEMIEAANVWERRTLSAESRVRELEQALGNLTMKLHEIDADPSLSGIFSIAAMHGFAYTGPNWKDSLIEADSALHAANKAAQNG